MKFTREDLNRVRELTYEKMGYDDYAACTDGFHTVNEEEISNIEVFEEIIDGADGDYCWTRFMTYWWWDEKPLFEVTILDFKKDEDGEMYIAQEHDCELDYEEAEDGHEVAFHFGTNLEEVIGYERQPA